MSSIRVVPWFEVRNINISTTHFLPYRMDVSYIKSKDDIFFRQSYMKSLQAFSLGGVFYSFFFLMMWVKHFYNKVKSPSLQSAFSYYNFQSRRRVLCQYVSFVFRYLWKNFLRRIFDHAVSWQSQILGRGLERIFQDVIEKYYNLCIIRKLIIACKNEFMMQGVQKK